MPAAMQINLNVSGLNQAAANFGALSREMAETARQIQAIQRASGGSRGGALQNAQTRMNGGKTGMGADLQGLMAFGRAGAIAYGVSEAFQFLKNQTMQAAESLSTFADAVNQTGGSASDIAGLNFGYGIPGGQITSMANAFRQRLESDPFAMMSGARAGISPQLDARFGGNQNNAELLQKGLDYLHGIQDQEERLLEARRLGLEGALKYVNVSDRVWKDLQADAAAAKAMGTDWQQLGNDFDAEMGRLTRNFQLNFLPVVKSLADLFGALATSQRPLLGGAGTTDLFGIGGPKPIAQNPIMPALKHNTDAVNKNTQALLQPGVYGGGTEAVRVNEFLRNQIWRQQAISGAFGMGLTGPGVF